MTGRRHEPGRRPEGRRAAPGGRVADAPPRVASERQRTTAACDRGRRAAARAAGRTRRIAWVADRPEERAVLEHRRLGEHDRTGHAHPRHDRGVGLGHPIAKLLVPSGTRQTGDVDPVLHGDRQAVQRTDRTVAFPGAIEHVGARQRVFIVPRRHTVGDLVQRVQPRERRLDGLARGLRFGHTPIMPRCRARHACNRELAQNARSGACRRTAR